MSPSRGVFRGLVRALLRLYPSAFRGSCAGEVEALVDDMEAEVRAGRLSRTRFVHGVLRDVTFGLFAEWLARLKGRPLPSPDRSRLGSAGGRHRPGSTVHTRRPRPSPMDRISQDLRYAFRMLVKQPAFSITAVVVLALGIGANTAVFSLVNAVLLRPMPGIEDPDRLVALYTGHRGGYVGVSSYMDYLDIRRDNEVFQEMAAFKPVAMDLWRASGTRRVEGMLVTATYFPTLGVEPRLGRFFLPEEDDDPGAETVAVLSHGAWRERFGGNPEVVGDDVTINGRAFTVVGVAPPEFRGTTRMEPPELFVPMAMQPHLMPASGNLLDNRGWGGIYVLGRLSPGASLARARAEVDALGEGLRVGYPDTNADRTYRLVPFEEAALPPGVRDVAVGMSRVLLATVIVVLLIVCVNVANLMLARGTVRRTELGVRQTLGASRWQLARQLLVESLVLAACGGLAGLVLGAWSTVLLERLPMPGMRLDFGLDPRTLGYTALATLATGVVFGLVPALRLTGGIPTGMLRREAGADGSDGLRLRNALVVGQVALSTVLLVAAGLFARTLVNLGASELGFRPDNVLVARLDPALQGYEGSELRAFYDRVRDRIEAIPGAGVVGLASTVPGDGGDDLGITVAGHQLEEGESFPVTGVVVIGKNYFRVLEIPLLQGRTFTEADRADAPPVVVVNESAARLVERLSGRPALGHRVGFNGPDGAMAEIVGVVADSRTRFPRGGGTAFAYIPRHQVPDGDLGSRMKVLVRTDGPPTALASALRESVRDVDASVPVVDVGTLEDQLAEATIPERVATAVLGSSAALALVIAAIGLYGLLAYTVGRRLGELGVRMALGATSGDLMRLVLRRGLLLVGGGAALGVVAAIAVARLLEGFLYAVSAVDPWTYLAVVGMLVAVGGLACYIPARRATRVDPVAALRSG